MACPGARNLLISHCMSRFYTLSVFWLSVSFQFYIGYYAGQEGRLQGEQEAYCIHTYRLPPKLCSNTCSQDDGAAEAASVSDCCEVCGCGGASKHCSCLAVRYCGRECQKAHWKTHKKSCRARLPGKKALEDKEWMDSVSGRVKIQADRAEAAAAAAAKATLDQAPAAKQIEVGDRVKVHGLQSAEGQKLNSAQAVAWEFFDGRWEVIFDTSKRKKIKLENLKLHITDVPPPAGPMFDTDVAIEYLHHVLTTSGPPSGWSKETTHRLFRKYRGECNY